MCPVDCVPIDNVRFVVVYALVLLPLVGFCVAMLLRKRERAHWLCQTHGPGRVEAWGCPDCVRELREERDALAARVEALGKYAAHRASCNGRSRYGTECDCGFDAAAAAARAK